MDCDSHQVQPVAHAPDSRRAFIRALAVGSAAPGLLLATYAQTASALATALPQGPRASVEQAYRLANRLSWGATDAEYEYVRHLGAKNYIDEQVRAVASNALPATVQKQIDRLQIQQVAMPQLVWELESQKKKAKAMLSESGRVATQKAYQQELNRLAREAATRHLLRAIYSKNQLQEQMTWFWFNHFNVHQRKQNIRAMLGDYEEQAIRPHVLGRFRDLLGAVVHHPAMLRYLDNEQNAAKRLNENFARELLELHTLGIDGGYGQHDVQELARVLSGHGVNLSKHQPTLKRQHAALYVREGLYEFHPKRHDSGEKQVLGRNIRARGAAELDDVLDMLAAHPSTARFVSRKIARHLLTDEPPSELVDQMAAAWGRSQGQIGTVLLVLLNAPEFTAQNSRKFKDPMHFVVSAVRACYGDHSVLNTGPMQNWLNRMGQGLYDRQTPDGYPSTAGSWSSSGQMATRFEIAQALGSGRAPLFMSDDAMKSRAQEPFPHLTGPMYDAVLKPMLGTPTRKALDAAISPQDWNTLYLSSPEFMYS